MDVDGGGGGGGVGVGDGGGDEAGEGGDRREEADRVDGLRLREAVEVEVIAGGVRHFFSVGVSPADILGF